MSDAAANRGMTDALAELEAAEPDAGAPDGDFQQQVDQLLARWRGWVDGMLVQADLGRMDVRDEAVETLNRVENAWLALKSEAERTGADAGSSAADLRRDTAILLADLRRAARAAIERLKAGTA